MMRWILLAAGLLCGVSTAAMGQAVSGVSHGGDLGLTYQWVHSNTQPGKCGCFSITGAGLSYSRVITPTVSGVLDISADSAKNGPDTGNSLTLVSYLAGARYYISQPWFTGDHAPQPFAQAIAGIAHAGGGIAGAADHNYALAARLGGGIDVPINYLVAVRLIQVDYYLTEFQNSTTQRQNNYLIGAGAVLRWSHVR